MAKNRPPLIGPQLPPPQDQTSEEGEDLCGPPPPDCIDPMTMAQRALEERALELKLGKNRTENVPEKREEWMVELPKDRSAKFGLGPRKFQTKTAPNQSSDCSGWTDKPGTSTSTTEREKRKEPIVDKPNVVTGEKRQSLLEIHRKKLRRETKETTNERRPFNREIDLEVSRLDDAQKRQILKKAQQLDDKFSVGKRKFL